MNPDVSKDPPSHVNTPIRNYGACHRFSDRVQRILTPGDWPARLAVALGAPTTVHEPFTNVSLCGLDDHGSGRPDADAALSGLLDLASRPFSLAFCGHTHGGQIALPDGRPVVVAHGALSRRYNQGR